MVPRSQLHSAHLQLLMALRRGWQYDEDVSEFFVVTDDNTSVKQSDTTMHREETDLQEA